MKIEEGVVVNVYPDRGTVRVKRQESDEMVSAELFVLFPGSLRNQFYSMPQIDEHVLCVYPDSKGSKGYVAGAFYSEASKPPVQDVDRHYVKFKDDSFIEHNTKTGQMTLYAKGDLHLEAGGEVYSHNQVEKSLG